MNGGKGESMSLERIGAMAVSVLWVGTAEECTNCCASLSLSVCASVSQDTPVWATGVEQT